MPDFTCTNRPVESQDSIFLEFKFTQCSPRSFLAHNKLMNVYSNNKCSNIEHRQLVRWDRVFSSRFFYSQDWTRPILVSTESAKEILNRLKIEWLRCAGTLLPLVSCMFNKIYSLPSSWVLQVFAILLCLFYSAALKKELSGIARSTDPKSTSCCQRLIPSRQFHPETFMGDHWVAFSNEFHKLERHEYWFPSKSLWERTHGKKNFACEKTNLVPIPLLLTSTLRLEIR